ncbi:MAG: hypothetical protein KJ601_03770 [Nanoarchaeota archaeon]|nr:hypothetical protein [Nanoarchaeota archaeon]
MPIRQGAYLEAAKKILELYNAAEMGYDAAEQREKVHKVIENLIRIRDSSAKLMKVYDSFYKAREGAFSGFVNRALRDVPHRFSGGWIKFNPVFDRKVNIQEMEGFAVNHKLYFTFAPRSTTLGKAYYEIKNYVMALNELYAEMQKLCHEVKDRITFKIPHSLMHILAHNDSLVVYFLKQESKAQIEQTVKRVFRKHQVNLIRRKALGNYGFDFHDGIQRIVHGHAKLVAFAVEEELKDAMMHLEWKPLAVAKWLKIEISRCKRKSMQDIYNDYARREISMFKDMDMAEMFSMLRSL